MGLNKGSFLLSFFIS